MNPNSVLALGHGGRQIVVDAAANVVYRIGVNGDIAPLAVFARRTVQSANGPVQVDEVPTDVARGPDGAFYVSTVTGAPFIGGAARSIASCRAGLRRATPPTSRPSRLSSSTTPASCTRSSTPRRRGRSVG